MSYWINDDKCVYICEDLAYNLVCYSTLDVIKADKFIKNLRISSNQSIQREREIIATIMKIFAGKSMARQYEIGCLSFEVDLCFLVHKLVVEIHEHCHVYYDEEKHQVRQQLIENLRFIFIRINPDVENFDSDIEIARIYNYITESSVTLVVNAEEKSFKENFAK